MERITTMRSMKLLAALAVVAVLVAGPVLAQAADTAPATMEAKPAKHHGHKGKMHHGHKGKKAEGAPVEAPAAQ